LCNDQVGLQFRARMFNLLNALMACLEPLLERVSKIVLYVPAILADALEIRVSQDRRNQGR
jgi:hypothetical protein